MKLHSSYETFDDASSVDSGYGDVIPAATQTDQAMHTLILNTLLRADCQTSPTPVIEQSRKLLQLVTQHYLSDEIFIRANGLLLKYLEQTGLKQLDESMLFACLTLAIKLNEHSDYLSMNLVVNPTAMINEETLCQALDWDLDCITPINYIEALLPFFADATLRFDLRESTYRFLTRCLTDVRCADLSIASLSIVCLQMACELTGVTHDIPEPIRSQTSLLSIRRILAH